MSRAHRYRVLIEAGDRALRRYTIDVREPTVPDAILTGRLLLTCRQHALWSFHRSVHVTDLCCRDQEPTSHTL